MCLPESLPVDLRYPSGAPVSMTEYLPLGFEERMKGRGMCYSGWALQHRIINHVAIGGLLTHCGWNSVLESVCAGVPHAYMAFLGRPKYEWPVFGGYCKAGIGAGNRAHRSSPGHREK